MRFLTDTSRGATRTTSPYALSLLGALTVWRGETSMLVVIDPRMVALGTVGHSGRRYGPGLTEPERPNDASSVPPPGIPLGLPHADFVKESLALAVGLVPSLLGLVGFSGPHRHRDDTGGQVGRPLH